MIAFDPPKDEDLEAVRAIIKRRIEVYRKRLERHQDIWTGKATRLVGGSRT